MADELDDLLDEQQEEEEKKSNKLIIVLVTILIVLIWLAIFVLLVKLDVGGFGSKVLYPVLKDVPVINKILPAASDEQVGIDSKYPYTTLSEAIARIQELEDENLTLNDAIAANADTIASLTAEVARLSPYEAYQKNYEELKRQFDEQIVFGNDYTGNYAADPATYINWYEQMDPENAAAIYQMALEKQASNQVVVDLSTTYSKMKAAQAATILEEMTGDEEKVASILANMTQANAASILQSMTPTYAAKITLLMYPSPYTVQEYRENRVQESQGKNPVGNPDGTHDGSNAPIGSTDSGNLTRNPDAINSVYNNNTNGTTTNNGTGTNTNGTTTNNGTGTNTNGTTTNNGTGTNTNGTTTNNGTGTNTNGTATNNGTGTNTNGTTTNNGTGTNTNGTATNNGTGTNTNGTATQ